MSPEQPFVHLHVHTEFSLLDGLSKIDKLVNRAKDLGMGSLAITDHGAMFGVIHFWRACQKAGIKPIIGMEGYLAKGSMATHDPSERQPYHLLLLAKDQTGYKNLLKIASAAQLEGFYSKPRVDKDFLNRHSAGLICTSGCLAAEIPRRIVEGRDDEARRQIGEYQDIFGKENFFLELQQHDIGELNVVNKWLIENQQFADVPFLATNDVHYVLDTDFDAHDTLLCIQTGTLKSEAKRMRMTDNSYYLRSQKEMWDIFGNVPDALTNTLLVAEMCDVNLDTKGYHLPVFPVPEGHTAETYLRYLAQRGLHWRYGEMADHPATQQRLDYELSVIHQMGFDTYFLIVWDLCQYATKADIWWNVRGSGAGSVTAFSLGITNIDPIANHLIFERFLNPGRVSMPDIDMDFPDDRRMDMIDYAMRKYGSDKVAAIITFGTMKARAAIKDVARALDYPLPEVANLTRMIPQIPSKPVTIADCLGDDPEKMVPELKERYNNDDGVKRLLDTALTVEGVARNAGTHAAGIIVGDRPLVEYLPLHRPLGGDTKVTQITQFPMEICESIGLLKVDFLGLSTLTIMRKACELIERYHGVRYTMANIPYQHNNDPDYDAKLDEAFDLIGRGETTGVFQLESAGMRRMLTEMKPRTFQHIIAAISLYRPGPLELIPTYIKRMHGEEEVKYHHPKLEPILKETYAICVYQEQIQQIAAQLFGYSLGDADMMRRAVSKKKAKDLATHKQIFMERGPEHGVSAEVAEKIFAEIEFFAAYGFNKCVTYNTEIIDAETGRLVRIGDVVTGKVSIEHTATCDIDRLRLQSGVVTDVWSNGIKPVYRLTTQLGRQIEATANHPFYTFGGWRRLDEMQAGDRIAIPRRITVEGHKTWPEHEVIVLGHLLAEGNLCHPHGLYYYTGSREQWLDYTTNLNKFENTVASTHERRNMYDVYGKRIDPRKPNGAVEWIERLGLRNANSYTKFIPDEVFELTNTQIALLIARMWDGDGFVDEKSRLAYYATSSERMAHQLQHLLLRLGIIARLRRVRFAYKDGRIGFQLHICGNNNLKAFSETVGIYFVSNERREKLARLVLTAPESQSTKDVIPLEVVHTVREEKAARNISWNEVAAQTGLAITTFNRTTHGTKSGFTHGVIQQLAEYFDSDTLRRHADNDIYWDEVASIEYIGEQPTYDITVPGTHNFIANDILVHNSHAADYAVLTIQTAYLKAHYAAEYYTALLSVQRNVIEDVKLFISDCRHFGIPVLPPDVNRSDIDFAIEETGKGKERGIRYGLGAIKNAGEKAIESIIESRLEGGPFEDISDFCRRVDLRAVGKRALESMAKVGAMDAFGDRDDLLASLDRIIKFSTDHHRAADVGQMSLFGGGEVASADALAMVAPKERTPNRDRLRWEKDLIGLYVSEHPLNAVEEAIRNLPNLQYSEVLKRDADQFNNKGVTVAGLVIGIRTLMTKNNDQMAIVTLEDVQGNINCTLFPRTWGQFKHLIVEDQVIMVRGKADSSRGDMQILAESVSQDFTYARAADEPSSYIAPDDRWEAVISGSGSQSRTMSAISPASPASSSDDSEEPPITFDFSEADSEAAEEPPLDSASPQNGSGNSGSSSGSGSGSSFHPTGGNGSHAAAVIVAPEAVAVLEAAPDSHANNDNGTESPAYVLEEEAFIEQSFVEEATSQPELPPCRITITFLRTNNPEQDRRRISRIQNELLEHPGNDQFRFRVAGPAQTFVIDFPDKTTSYIAVEAKLLQEFGEELIQVELLE